MAKFELKIYKGDEVEKTYAVNHCPWGLYTEAADVQDHIKTMAGNDVIKSVGNIMLQLFEGLTTEDLQRADGHEVMSLFVQLVSPDASKGSKAIKNA
ncbi:MAG: hypothetical protein IKU08_09290 [Clostridia bacterium]|nr:hypothetical protein [Clostridia bacterium]